MPAIVSQLAPGHSLEMNQVFTLLQHWFGSGSGCSLIRLMHDRHATDVALVLAFNFQWHSYAYSRA